MNFKLFAFVIFTLVKVCAFSQNDTNSFGSLNIETFETYQDSILARVKIQIISNNFSDTILTETDSLGRLRIELSEGYYYVIASKNNYQPFDFKRALIVRNKITFISMPLQYQRKRKRIQLIRVN